MKQIKIYEPIKKFEFSATYDEIREARRKKAIRMANTTENRLRRIIERGKQRDYRQRKRERELKRKQENDSKPIHYHKMY